MPMSEVLQITLEVAHILEGLGVSYALCGSMASSVHGIPRATQDVDMVADLREENVEELSAALGSAYYHDIDRMRDAIRRRGSFNVIHIATAFKVDIFVPKGDTLSRAEIEGRQRISVGEGEGEALWVASPEDTIVQKLYWYHLGGCVSDRQWDDVAGILKVQGREGNLRLDYMVWGASIRGIPDLLAKALLEAGFSKPKMGN